MVKALGNQKTGSDQFLDWFLVCTGFNPFYTSLSANILQLSIGNFVTILPSFQINPRTLIYIKNWCFYKISLVHILFSTIFYIFNYISVNFEPMTRPGIEPKTFWTYTRCSNQLSYPALEFNQLILYLYNCQPKDTYSARHIQCHSLYARSTCDQDMTRLVNLETMWQIT